MPDLAKAELIELNTQLTDIDPSGQRVKVQFNPDTLKVSFANQIKNDQQSGKDQAQGSAGRQYVGAGTTKLALQLWFDVSAAIEPRHKVDDVRRLTQQVIYFITPRQLGNDSTRFVPPGVRFAWGSFKFDGLVDGIEETLEFFSPEGKPLRASIALTMSQQKILKAEFGPAAGAFTDAKQDYPGLIALASGGTLFLDEIDALPPKGQVALLRFLQDRQYRSVGGKQFVTADVRLIAASNRNLTELVASGGFRDDLLYRLKLLFVELPPLRQRSGDPTLLAQYFMRQGAERFNVPAVEFHPDTLHWFERYAWPGNVRELENLVYRELLLSDGVPIQVWADAAVRDDRRRSPDRRKVDYTGLSYGEAKALVMADFERRYLVELVARTGGNVTAAAKLAGKERRAFGRLLQKYRIDRAQFGD